LILPRFDSPGSYIGTYIMVERSFVKDDR